MYCGCQCEPPFSGEANGMVDALRVNVGLPTSVDALQAMLPAIGN